MKKLTILILILLTFSTVCYLKHDDIIKVDAVSNLTAEIAIERSTKRVLYGSNIHVKKFMASTTKILTAITVIENCDIDEVVTVGKETVGVEGSSIYLKAGEKISVKNLLFGLMLRSGNDCAETLAVHCSKSIEKFAELMNKTAKKIGANESNFMNPHGLHNDEHYTTAYDLAIISAYAMENDIFREIVSTKKTVVPKSTGEYDRLLINKNKMLSKYDGATGIKTGYTKKAGRCLVSSALKNGMEIITVVLNCGPMWERSANMLDYCFENYSLNKLVESDNVIGFSEIEGESELCALTTDKDIILPLSNGEKESLKIIYDYPKKLQKPIKKGQKVGEIKIYALNNLIFSQEIYTIIEKN